jgi:hypothetical protein
VKKLSNRLKATGEMCFVMPLYNAIRAVIHKAEHTSGVFFIILEPARAPMGAAIPKVSIPKMLPLTNKKKV